jgi:PKD repeat protein
MKSFALLLLVFLGLQQGRLNAQSELLDQTPLFFEDFEGYPENGYPGSFTQLYNGTGNANQKVITTAGADGADTKVFRLQGASSWASEHIVTLPATLPSVLVIDALIKPVSGAWPGRFGLRNPTGTWGTRVSAVLFDGSGKITALRNGSDSDKITLGSYSMNVWYRVTLVHDIGAKTYDVYIDGELLGAGIPMHATLNPTQFHLTSGNSGTNEIYYDNTGFYEDVPFLMTADFSGSARNGCLPLEVQFSDLSTGSPDGWAWYFGDEDFGGSWEEMSGAAGWEKRDGHSSVALPDGSIVVMGGMTTLHKNDVWRSADRGSSWTLMTDNAPWAARKGHSSVSLPDGSILLLGGHDGSGFKNDVWRSADRGANWTLMTDNAGWTPRDQAPSAALPDGSVLMMSGRNGILRDVWRSEDMGATWTLVTDNAGWTPRDGAACALLPDSSLVMLGGGSGLSNDVWRSEDFGATWTRMTAAAGWSGRIYHACVALPDGTLMVAGGSDPYGPKNDVWFSKDQGATWTEVAGSPGWAHRYGHSAVVLPGGNVLIIGGRSPESSNDVWRLSTAGSTEQNPVHTYAQEGHFPVTLQVHRPSQVHTVRSDGYISTQAAPAAAGTITGAIEACAGEGPFTYSIPEIDGATSYLWTLPQGATGSSTSTAIEVVFDAGAASGEISVSASNACGSGAAAILNITVNPVPPAPEITQNGNTLQSSAASGNQWYDQDGPIVGATGQTYTPQTEGAYYVEVTLAGCSSEKSNTLLFVITGLQPGATAPAFRVYPNPVSSELVLEMAERAESTRIELLDITGQIRFRGSVSGRTVIPIGHLPKGVYFLLLENSSVRELRKIVRD